VSDRLRVRLSNLQIVSGLVGDVAQLGEHLPCKQEVGGSTPLISTIVKYSKRSTEARKSNVL
jgi:hypothetical protein